MRTHIIPRKPDVLDWAKIPQVPIDTVLWKPKTDIEARAQICYDDTALYVHLCAKEKNIRAEAKSSDLLGQPCKDSCLEFFFCPCPGDRRYFNIELNPNGCLFLGMGSGNHDLVRLLPDGETPLLEVQPSRTADGWEVFYQVPYSFVRRFFPNFAPASGQSIRANFYKCGDLTVQEHYMSWNPVENKVPTFHSPDDFGTLTFE